MLRKIIIKLLGTGDGTVRKKLIDTVGLIRRLIVRIENSRHCPGTASSFTHQLLSDRSPPKKCVCYRGRS